MKHNRIVTHAYAQARVEMGKRDCFDGCKHLKTLTKKEATELLKKRRGADGSKS